LVLAVRGTPYPIGQKAEPLAALKEAAESSDPELRAEAAEIVSRLARPKGGKGAKTTPEPKLESDKEPAEKKEAP
jgi:hypothetical protein